MKMKKWIAMVLVLVLAVSLLPTVLAAENYLTMEQKYGMEAAANWQWLGENLDSKHADVYRWYCETKGPSTAWTFWFHCSPNSVQHYRGSFPDSTSESIHQMALDQLKEDSESMYRYLVVGDITLEEATGRPDTPVPQPESVAPSLDEDISFTDVNEGDWYYEAVMALARAGILTGKGDGIFDPNADITVGEMAALICRIDPKIFPFSLYSSTLETELYGERTFEEPTSWAHEYIMGVRKRTSTDEKDLYRYPLWDPEAFAEPVMRGEAMAVCCGMAARMRRYTPYISAADARGRYEWRNGYRGDSNSMLYTYVVPNLDAEVHNPECGCSEYTKAEHKWTAKNVGHAYLLNIVHGVDSAGTANAHGNLSRAEFCQMLYNMGIQDSNTVNNEKLMPDPYVMPGTLAAWREMQQ